MRSRLLLGAAVAAALGLAVYVSRRPGGPIATTPAGKPPTVTKVDPPSWWPGHSISPLQLLVRGENLTGARVENADGISVSKVRVNEQGTYAFVDVAIDPNARPGQRHLRVVTPSGGAEATLDVLTPLPPEGRFQGFSRDDIIYLIMPDRFANGDPTNDDPAVSRGLLNRDKPRYYHGGDLQGIIDHIPYFVDLGVTALWINPVYDNANRKNERETYDGEAIADYHGYGAIDFYGVEEHFGDMAKLRELVDAAHRANIKVIIDQVANHVGPYHPWAKNPPSPTWFHGTEEGHLKLSFDAHPVSDPSATPEQRKPILDGWFIDILPDMNQDDPEASRYLIQNALWWVGMTGFDAIRQDTMPYVHRSFWRDWMAALKRQYPKLRVVGEVFDKDPAFVSFFQGGSKRFDGIDSGVDTVFDFPLMYKLRHAFAERKSLRDVASMLENDRLYNDPSILVTFVGLHDLTRFMGEPSATIAGLALAETFLLTARGIPLLYYGDEIAMAGGNDPENRRDFPGEWTDQDRSRLRAEPSSALPGIDPKAAELRDQIRRLTHLRSELVALRDGAMAMLDATDDTLAFARVTGDQSVVVVFNNAEKSLPLRFAVAAANLPDGTVLKDALGRARDVTIARGAFAGELPPRSAAVYTTKR